LYFIFYNNLLETINDYNEKEVPKSPDLGNIVSCLYLRRRESTWKQWWRCFAASFTYLHL